MQYDVVMQSLCNTAIKITPCMCMLILPVKAVRRY